MSYINRNFILMLKIHSGFIIYASYELDAFDKITKVHEKFMRFISRYGNLRSSTIKVRFADINVPKLNTQIRHRSRMALNKLIYNKYIHLNVNDLYTFDKYDRAIAITYICH